MLINTYYSERVLEENKFNEEYTKVLQGIYIQVSVFSTIKLHYSVCASSSFSFYGGYKTEIYLSQWQEESCPLTILIASEQKHGDNQPLGQTALNRCCSNDIPTAPHRVRHS